MDKRLAIVIAEAGLELVPRELWGHPAVYKAARKRGKRPGEVLLDSSLHHQALKSIPYSAKRGRPDIVHMELLEALESPLNKKRIMSVYVHTINDYTIYVSPETRLPRNYNRFVGLMEQLLLVGQVPPPPAKPLLWIKPMKLKPLLESIGACKVVAISGLGDKRKFREIAYEIVKKPCTAVLIKGFTNAEFSDAVLSVADVIYAPTVEDLEPWIHLSHLLAHLADILGIA